MRRRLPLLADTAEQAEAVVVELDRLSDAAFAAGLDIVDGTIIGELKLDPLTAGVHGPLYQPSCTFFTDDLGRVVPGDCACRFPSAATQIASNSSSRTKDALRYMQTAQGARGHEEAVLKASRRRLGDGPQYAQGMNNLTVALDELRVRDPR